MPKKKKFNPSWIFGPLIILLIIAAIIFFFVGLSKGWFGVEQKFGDLNLIELFGGEPDAECTFVVDNETVCLWDNVTGIINANSPVCYIGYNYNNEGWRFAGVIDEVSPGFYQESRQATVIGHYEFAAICGTPSDFCRTNDVEVDVIICDEPTEEYTCGWVGDQCGGTCPDTHPLCVDMWYEDNALFGDNSYAFCACIDPDTETVHPDWKPDGQYHDDEGPAPNGEPEDTGVYTCGQGSDAQCGGTCPSSYPDCSKDFTDLYLYNCVCKDANQEIHPDWQLGGSMFNEQGEYPPEESLCIDSDGVNVFTVGTTTYLGSSYPDVCHAGAYYAVDEYVCIDDVAVKKEIQCPYGPVGGCADGRCVTGTTTVYNECLNIGYANGGGCYSGSSPVAHPELDLFCGDLYPLNHAICFN